MTYTTKTNQKKVVLNLIQIIQNLHNRYVFQRRTDVLSTIIFNLLIKDSTVLDVGCGDGIISRKVMDKGGKIDYTGIDVMTRPSCAIPFKTFDGLNIPYENDSFQIVQIIDVLHHTNNIKELLYDSTRVSKEFILIKDHEYKTTLDFQILKFMDWIGNKPHGVKLIYNFKTRKYWEKLFMDLNLEVISYSNNLHIYPIPFHLIFGRNLHFVALLKKKK